jgi:hypothetical protein
MPALSPLTFSLIAGPMLQEGPAETSAYFIAGYVVIFGVMALYLASLILRRRNVQQDLETLEQVEERRQ